MSLGEMDTHCCCCLLQVKKLHWHMQPVKTVNWVLFLSLYRSLCPTFKSWHVPCWHLSTFDGLALGQDGDCSLCHLLLMHNRRDLGAPAVWAHPDEMTRLVCLFSSVEQPPVKVRKQMLPWIRSVPTAHYTVCWQSLCEAAVFRHGSVCCGCGVF